MYTVTLSPEGVWEGGPEGYRGQFIFTDTHYCGLFTTIDRDHIQADGLSVEEEAEAFRSLMAGAGTYSVEGSKLTLSTDYDRIPRPKYTSNWDMDLEGETLMLTSPSGRVWTLRRLA